MYHLVRTIYGISNAKILTEETEISINEIINILEKKNNIINFKTTVFPRLVRARELIGFQKKSQDFRFILLFSMLKI